MEVPEKEQEGTREWSLTEEIERVLSGGLDSHGNRRSCLSDLIGQK